MLHKLVRYRPTAEYQLLHRLLDGETVFLYVDSEKVPSKRRVLPPVLALELVSTPLGRNALLAALHPYGCELMMLPEELSVYRFMRIGLPHAMAKAIHKALITLVIGGVNGT